MFLFLFFYFKYYIITILLAIKRNILYIGYYNIDDHNDVILLTNMAYLFIGWWLENFN